MLQYCAILRRNYVQRGFASNTFTYRLNQWHYIGNIMVRFLFDFQNELSVSEHRLLLKKKCSSLLTYVNSILYIETGKCFTNNNNIILSLGYLLHNEYVTTHIFYTFK